MIRPTTTPTSRLLLRSALRNTTPLTPLNPQPAPAAARRAFSIQSAAKNLDRTLHPYQGYPRTQKSQRADWGAQVRHLGRGAIFYFPGFATILGWPLVVAKVLDGHM